MNEMDINAQMKEKMNQIEATRADRQLLFVNEEANTDKIAELYWNVEKMQLEYMLLKREQLNGFKLTNRDFDVVERVEKINETCINLATKRLIEHGQLH